MSTIGLIDYGMGNRRSVQKALEHVGANVVLTADQEQLAAADGLVLPGVGAFPAGIAGLKELGLDLFIKQQVAEDKPLLGICLGMQLLFEYSDEHGGADGLGVIPGKITELPAAGMKLPHIGWNGVRFLKPSPLTAGLGEIAAFYHVHSYAMTDLTSEKTLGVGEYGGKFASIVGSGNTFGVQFHPEKSGSDGLQLLRNFCLLAKQFETKS